MPEERVLVAGVGNILEGDDAFGIFAIRELEERGLPQGVRLANAGVRSQELATEIQNGYEAVILLETAAQGGEPGTLYVFDPEVDPVEAGQAIFGSRGMAPEDALKVLDAFDGYSGQILIVGCEPESFESVDGLSDSVESAVPKAVNLLESILLKLLERDGHDVEAGRDHLEGPPEQLTELAPQPAAA